MLPKQTIGALKKIRIKPLINCVTCEVSFVMRVISEPGSNRSHSDSATPMIFSNKSYRSSLPTCWDTKLASVFRVTAKTAPSAVAASIKNPQRTTCC